MQEMIRQATFPQPRQIPMLPDGLTRQPPPTATARSVEDEHLAIDGFGIQVSIQPATEGPHPLTLHTQVSHRPYQLLPGAERPDQGE